MARSGQAEILQLNGALEAAEMLEEAGVLESYAPVAQISAQVLVEDATELVVHRE